MFDFDSPLGSVFSAVLVVILLVLFVGLSAWIVSWVGLPVGFFLPLFAVLFSLFLWGLMKWWDFQAEKMNEKFRQEEEEDNEVNKFE